MKPLLLTISILCFLPAVTYADPGLTPQSTLAYDLLKRQYEMNAQPQKYLPTFEDPFGRLITASKEFKPAGDPELPGYGGRAACILDANRPNAITSGYVTYNPANVEIQIRHINNTGQKVHTVLNTTGYSSFTWEDLPDGDRVLRRLNGEELGRFTPPRRTLPIEPVASQCAKPAGVVQNPLANPCTCPNTRNIRPPRVSAGRFSANFAGSAGQVAGPMVIAMAGDAIGGYIENNTKDENGEGLMLRCIGTGPGDMFKRWTGLNWLDQLENPDRYRYGREQALIKDALEKTRQPLSIGGIQLIE